MHCRVQTALEYAESAGQLFVTAAGNDYGVDIDKVPVYPASYQNRNIISVIATDQNRMLAAYSNYGQRSTDIAAPGSNILSTVLAGQYGYFSSSRLGCLVCRLMLAKMLIHCLFACTIGKVQA